MISNCFYFNFFFWADYTYADSDDGTCPGVPTQQNIAQNGECYNIIGADADETVQSAISTWIGICEPGNV